MLSVEAAKNQKAGIEWATAHPVENVLITADLASNVIMVADGAYEVKILVKGVPLIIKGIRAGSIAEAKIIAMETVKAELKIGSKDTIEGGVKLNFGKKLEYIFGNATGTKHNIDRSIAMENQLKKIGILDDEAGRKLVLENLTKAFNDPSSILKEQENGRIVRESLLAGPDGFVKVESIWEDAKLVTVTILGGKK
jgi:hypothetical protein